MRRWTRIVLKFVANRSNCSQNCEPGKLVETKLQNSVTFIFLKIYDIPLAKYAMTIFLNYLSLFKNMWKVMEAWKGNTFCLNETTSSIHDTEWTWPASHYRSPDAYKHYVIQLAFIWITSLQFCFYQNMEFKNDLVSRCVEHLKSQNVVIKMRSQPDHPSRLIRFQKNANAWDWPSFELCYLNYN